jgi:hypothetical protein
MNWVLIVGLAWVMVAVLGALVIGRAIYLAGERESPRTPRVPRRHTRPRGPSLGPARYHRNDARRTPTR